MPKLFVTNSYLYDGENDQNFAVLNSEQEDNFKTSQVKIINRHGEHVFDTIFYSLMPFDSIGLTRRQRENCGLKKNHRYYVLPHTPSETPVTLASIFDQKYNYRKYVGGMDDVLETIFGDILLCRLYPKAFVDLTDVKRPRGFILHGIPGTGKTLVAKTIANILNVEPKIVSGPELFNRFLGESEAKVRALFTDAHNDQEKYGARSPLHIIIFDEIDAICKQRSRDDSSVRYLAFDSITTQLLTEIDGLKHLDNILVIGTTNSISSIDQALIRPGRLDVLVELKLPNARGRSEIFQIYTQQLLQNSIMSDDIDVGRLIDQTQGFTGAHIEQLVRRAVNSAMRRDIISRRSITILDEDAEQLQVKSIDFHMALKQIRTTMQKHTAF